MDKRVYVTDFIGDEYLQWKEGEKVIISTPTGSGKTTFVISKLLQQAVAQGKHIIYYCNRKVLHEQFTVRSREDIFACYVSERAQTMEKWGVRFCLPPVLRRKE